MKKSGFLLILMMTLICCNYRVFSQNFMPSLNRNNAIQKDTTDRYFKEVWLKSKDVSKDNAYGFMERASKKIELGYYKEAMTDINKSLKIDSTIAYTYTLKGLCMLRQDSVNIARFCFHKANQIDSSEVINYLYLAEIYYYDNKLRTADSLYRKCISKKPNMAEAYFGLANISYLTERYKEAEKLYKQVIDLDPNFLMAYFNLAIYYSDFNFDKAIRYFGKVTDVAPDFSPAYYYRGLLKMFRANDIRMGLNDWNKAIEIDSTNSLYRTSRGFLYIFNKKYDEAIHEFFYVADLRNQNEFNSDFEKSENALRAALFYEQLLIYKKYYKNFTAEQQSIINKALCLFYKEDFQEVDVLYNKLLKLNNQKGLVYFLKGNNLNYLKKYDEADACFKNAIGQNEFPSQTYLWSANNLMFLEKYPEAIQQLNIFITKNDSVKFAFRNRGISYVQIQQYDSALQDFDRFLKLDSTESDIYFNRAVCYKAKEDYKKAIENFDFTIKYSTKKTDMESIVLRSECAYIIGDTLGAFKFLRQTLDSAEWLSESGHLLLGQIYLDYKNYDSAIVQFNDYMRFITNNTDVFILRAKAYYLKNDFQNAINDFTRALNINYNDMYAHYGRGLAMIKLNNPEGALKDFEMAEKLGHPLARRAIKVFLKDYKPESINGGQ